MRVLVTRSEPAASRTASRLKALGHEPVILPLSRIDPIIPPPTLETEKFDAIAFTSANAPKFMDHALRQSVSGLRCFAVGDRTAKQARAVGFTEVTSADGDAEALAALIKSEIPAGARLLYPCGRTRRPTFETAMQLSGILVTAFEIYEATQVDITDPAISEGLGQVEIDAVLVYSAEAAVTVKRLAELTAASNLLSHSRFIGISSRASAVLSTTSQNILTAPEPTETSLLSVLRDISPTRP